MLHLARWCFHSPFAWTSISLNGDISTSSGSCVNRKADYIRGVRDRLWRPSDSFCWVTRRQSHCGVPTPIYSKDLSYSLGESVRHTHTLLQLLNDITAAVYGRESRAITTHPHLKQFNNCTETLALSTHTADIIHLKSSAKPFDPICFLSAND